MTDCIFCKIVQGQISADTVYEDELLLAFRDINAQAPHHVLIIPKQHLSGLNDLAHASDALLSAIVRAASEVARIEGIDQSGYRLISNSGPHACQSVFHLHFHVVGGRQLSGQMG